LKVDPAVRGALRRLRNTTARLKQRVGTAEQIPDDWRN